MNTQEKLDLINKELNICYLSLDEVDWSFISECQKLSEGFIREFQDFVDWECISKHQKLSESFIREFQGRVDWCYISAHQKLSEEFIREFQGTVYWRYISKYQKLSGSFIREYEDFVDWINISKYQNLSENFIREFQDFVDWDCISAYQKLSESFIREFEDKLNKELINDNWSYKDTGFLKERVMSTGLYECHDDYFIAYKGIRSDRCSRYNFQYRYMPGETYESFCDCSSNENSFGLSVWTEEKAAKYCDELVVKVKVGYEDVGRVVHDGGKIRCRRITILN